MSKSTDGGKNPTMDSGESEIQVPTAFLSEQYAEDSTLDVTALNYAEEPFVAELSLDMNFGEVCVTLDEDTARVVLQELQEALKNSEWANE